MRGSVPVDNAGASGPGDTTRFHIGFSYHVAQGPVREICTLWLDSGLTVSEAGNSEQPRVE